MDNPGIKNDDNRSQILIFTTREYDVVMCSVAFVCVCVSGSCLKTTNNLIS